MCGHPGMPSTWAAMRWLTHSLTLSPNGHEGAHCTAGCGSESVSKSAAMCWYVSPPELSPLQFRLLPPHGRRGQTCLCRPGLVRRPSLRQAAPQLQPPQLEASPPASARTWQRPDCRRRRCAHPSAAGGPPPRSHCPPSLPHNPQPAGHATAMYKTVVRFGRPLAVEPLGRFEPLPLAITAGQILVGQPLTPCPGRHFG